jgi:signal transduction histidine kinase
MLMAVELLLGLLGMPLPLRAIVTLAGATALGWAAHREVKDLLNDLDGIRRSIDDTARGQFESPIPAMLIDETEELGQAVHDLRGRLAEIGRRLVEALRIESLNMLGSILVHDMKNLSFRLRCLSQNLAANYDDPTFRDSLVRTLDDTTEKMDQMVRRFREQKKMVTVKIRVNLNDIVHSAVSNLRRDAADIRVTEQYGELPLIWADALLVENAIFNIADNACDAMAEGGRLLVRTNLVENGGNGHRKVVIDIADTGVGMSETFIRNELFAPFVTTKPRGLGLGLYTCQQIIQMHDGEVHVRSAPGRGTIFSVSLPVTD